VQLQDVWGRLTNKWVLGCAISLVAALAALLLGLTSTFKNLELKSYDVRFAFRGAEDAPKSDIAIVALDEQAIASIPQKLPYPRSYYAKLVDNLTAAGAHLIIFDVEFTEPSVVNPEEDLVFARAIQRSGRVILAGKVVIDWAKNDILNTYLLEPIPPLLAANADWGLINVVEDQDGFIRRYLLYQEFNHQKFLPLALRAYLRLTKGKAELNHAATNGALRLNGLELPHFNSNTFLINFCGPAGTYPTYSLANILDDSSFMLNEVEDTDIFEQHLQWGTFKNKIVFVGASADELQDNKFTPFFSKDDSVKRKMPGVEVHANALSTLLRRNFITRLPDRLEVVMIVVASFLTMLIVLPARALISAVFGILEIVAILLLAMKFFSAQQLWVPVVGPITAVVLSYLGNSAQLVVFERRERRYVRKVFSQFVSKSVVDSMLASGQMPKFGGEKRELSILFSDVRGFTTYCEKHPEEVVVQRLNEYLTEMVEIVFRNQGTLDKFIGDAVMALYGAPFLYAEHAEKACVTACEMIASLRGIQKRWSAKAEDYFQIGIGINTGTVIVGNMGSQQKFEYTVIGDEVNMASRLEGANKQYWTSIIISESTYLQVKDKARVRELDFVRVKGKKKPAKIYELCSMEKLPAIEEDLLIDVYHSGLRYYKQQEWYKALREFKRVLRYFPSDGPSRVYVTRCLDFLVNPPPADWDGVYEFKTK
jgi:adenylate cyclase